MEVILLEKVRNVGNLGDKAKVKDGFGRNYLLPKGKAASATPANLEAFEKRRAELEKHAADTLAQAKTQAEKITAMGSITIGAKIAEEGKLYGSVSIGDIAEKLAQAGITVSKSEIQLPEGHIRHIGEYEAHIYFHSDVSAVLKINVVPE